MRFTNIKHISHDFIRNNFICYSKVTPSVGHLCNASNGIYAVQVNHLFSATM